MACCLPSRQAAPSCARIISFPARRLPRSLPIRDAGDIARVRMTMPPCHSLSRCHLSRPGQCKDRDLMTIALSIIGGLLLLMFGAEFLVRGAVQVAIRLGVSSLVIGLTLVGFGTSTPELVTSVQAALAGSPGIAYGNIVGSNIANTLLILGVAALISPILVASNAIRRDSMVMVGAMIAFAGLSAVVDFGRLVGIAFLAGLAIYLLAAFRQESGADAGQDAASPRREEGGEANPGSVPAAAPAARRSMLVSLLLAVTGLGLVVLGAHFLVGGAVDLARVLGISETIIGLTIVAIGTSMPELVTSVMAALRSQGDVAFGNVVGSSIYNILGIGGTTALIAPVAVPEEIVRFDNPVMIAASLLLVVFAWTGLRVGRREGGLLLAGYVLYIAVLWP